MEIKNEKYIEDRVGRHALYVRNKNTFSKAGGGAKLDKEQDQR